MKIEKYNELQSSKKFDKNGKSLRSLYSTYIPFFDLIEYTNCFEHGIISINNYGFNISKVSNILNNNVITFGVLKSDSSYNFILIISDDVDIFSNEENPRMSTTIFAEKNRVKSNFLTNIMHRIFKIDKTPFDIDIEVFEGEANNISLPVNFTLSYTDSIEMWTDPKYKERNKVKYININKCKILKFSPKYTLTSITNLFLNMFGENINVKFEHEEQQEKEILVEPTYIVDITKRFKKKVLVDKEDNFINIDKIDLREYDIFRNGDYIINVNKTNIEVGDKLFNRQELYKNISI